jgi:hypothetical protein
MRLAAIEQGSARECLPPEIECPEVALGTARADRAPEVVRGVALPELHQPGDGFALEIADLRPIVRADIGIAQVVDEVARKLRRYGRLRDQIVRISQMVVVGSPQPVLDLSEQPLRDGLPDRGVVSREG